MNKALTLFAFGLLLISHDASADIIWTSPAAPQISLPVSASTPEMTPIPWPPHPFDLGEEEKGVTSGALPAPPPLPAAIPYQPGHKPMIAIVIDDMGVDVKHSAEALDLPPGVTMSYLPYGRKITEQVETAKSKGHEIILHIPMQAMNAKENPGPHHLRVDMTPAQLEENIAASLDAFAGYDGVNNHEGSKFTAYKPGLDIFMAALEKRHVFFLDSRTSRQSVAEEVAREHHLRTTRRDVFLDHVERTAFVSAALRHTEDVARRTGSAIAIGHPKNVTLHALKKWLETLEAKGFRIVPLSVVVEYRNHPPVCVGSTTLLRF